MTRLTSLMLLWLLALAGCAGTTWAAGHRGTGGGIDVIESDRHSGVTSMWLKNGLRVHHRRMGEPSDQVFVHVSVAGGVIEEDADHRGLSQLCVAAWSIPACRSRDPNQMHITLATSAIQIDADCGPDTLQMYLKAPTKSIDALMETVSLLLDEPLLGTRAMAHRKAELAQAAESRWSATVLDRALIGSVFPNDPRLEPLRADVGSGQSLEKAQAWLDRIVGENPIEIAIVGDIDLADVIPAVDSRLARITARARISSTWFQEERTLEFPNEPVLHRTTSQDLTDLAIVTVGFRGAPLRDAPAYRSLWVAADVLRQRVVSSIDKLDATTGSIMFKAIPSIAYPGTGRFEAVVECDPDAVDRISTLLEDHVERLRQQPPTDDEVRTAADRLAEEANRYASSPMGWSWFLSQSTYRDLETSILLDGATTYRQMTPSDVTASVRRFGTPDRSYSMTVLPE